MVDLSNPSLMVSTRPCGENALQETFKVFINSTGKSQDPGILFFRLLIKTAGVRMNSPFFPKSFTRNIPLLETYKRTRIQPKTSPQLKGAEPLRGAGCASSCQPKGTAKGD